MYTQRIVLINIVSSSDAFLLPTRRNTAKEATPIPSPQIRDRGKMIAPLIETVLPNMSAGNIWRYDFEYGQISKR